MKNSKKYFSGWLAVLLCTAVLWGAAPLVAMAEEPAADIPDVTNDAEVPGPESGPDGTLTGTELDTSDAPESSQGAPPTSVPPDATPLGVLGDGALGGVSSTNGIDLADQAVDSGVGWMFDGLGTYTITDDVYVYGESTGSSYSNGAITFDISNGGTVTWSAEFEGETADPDDALVSVTGTGVFTMEEGEISQSGPGIALQAGDGVEVYLYGGGIFAPEGGTGICGGSTVVLNGGNVWADDECVAIDAKDVVVKRGSAVTAWGESYPCIAIRATGDVTVTDDSEVYATSNVGQVAIHAGGHVTVADSMVVAPNRSSDTNPCGVAIYTENPVQIHISGTSRLWAPGGVILAPRASVTLKDQATLDVNGALMYTEGTLYGNTIMAENVTVEDSVRVRALNGAAVFYSGTLAVNGGLLCAFGDGIGGARFTIDDNQGGGEPDIGHMLNVIFKAQQMDIQPNIEYVDGSSPAAHVGGDGIVIGWDFVTWWNANPSYDYDPGDITDLFVCPEEGVEYGWTTGNGMYFRYSKGDNSGRYWFALLNPGKPIKPNPKAEPVEDNDSGDGESSAAGASSRSGGSGNSGGHNDDDYILPAGGGGGESTTGGSPGAAPPYTDTQTASGLPDADAASHGTAAEESAVATWAPPPQQTTEPETPEGGTSPLAVGMAAALLLAGGVWWFVKTRPPGQGKTP